MFKSNCRPKLNMQNSTTQNHEIWNFNAPDLIYIFIDDRRNALKLQNMSKNQSWKETGPSQDKTFVCLDNLGQNLLNKMEKSSETGQEKKGFFYLFLRVSTAIAKA